MSCSRRCSRCYRWRQRGARRITQSSEPTLFSQSPLSSRIQCLPIDCRAQALERPPLWRMVGRAFPVPPAPNSEPYRKHPRTLHVVNRGVREPAIAKHRQSSVAASWHRPFSIVAFLLDREPSTWCCVAVDGRYVSRLCYCMSVQGVRHPACAQRGCATIMGIQLSG